MADDSIQALREENSRLKQERHQQEGKVRELGVKMSRIRVGLQQQAVQKDLPPAQRAAERKELSKDDRIAELEMALVKRDAKEERLSQQVSLYKQAATGGRGGGRGGGRPAGPKRPGARTRAATMPAPRLGTLPVEVQEQHAPASVAASVDLSMDESGGGDQAHLNSLLQMMQSKIDPNVHYPSQPSQPPLPFPPQSQIHLETPAAALGSVQESSQIIGLRRDLKDRTAQLTLLQQRWVLLRPCPFHCVYARVCI